MPYQYDRGPTSSTSYNYDRGVPPSYSYDRKQAGKHPDVSAINRASKRIIAGYQEYLQRLTGLTFDGSAHEDRFSQSKVTISVYNWDTQGNYRRIEIEVDIQATSRSFEPSGTYTVDATVRDKARRSRGSIRMENATLDDLKMPGFVLDRLKNDILETLSGSNKKDLEMVSNYLSGIKKEHLELDGAISQLEAAVSNMTDPLKSADEISKLAWAVERKGGSVESAAQGLQNAIEQMKRAAK